MNQPGELDQGAVAARRLLLDVLEALGPARSRIVLVGAQAVLMHIGAGPAPVVLATFDGDLGLDPRDPPTSDLAAVLEGVGLHLAETDGALQPGIWVPKESVEGVALSIDVLVPEVFAPRRGKRGADIQGQRSDMARYVRGLEASIVDRQPRLIASLEPTDGRRTTAPVAGPSGLVIAKLHKLSDRIANARRPDRVHSKDCYEVFRLMQLPEEQVLSGWIAAASDEMARAISVSAIDMLEALFATEGAIGSSLAGEHVAEFEDPRLVRESAMVLARELVGKLRQQM